jgi:hemoglobin
MNTAILITISTGKNFPIFYRAIFAVMEQRSDIQNRADIEKLINSFYEKVRSDEVIGFFFSEIVPVNWPAHLPRMYDFWESIAFGTASYKGEPMTVHMNLNRMHEMSAEHFNRWITLFRSTVDEHFSGPKADEIKKRAESIAMIMQLKVKG